MTILFLTTGFFLGGTHSLNHAAEPTLDPRLVKIAEQAEKLVMQREMARLSFENAQLKLKELGEAEEKIKAEKSVPEKSKAK